MIHDWKDIAVLLVAAFVYNYLIIYAMVRTRSIHVYILGGLIGILFNFALLHPIYLWAVK